jgi:hypothetical protein
MMGSRSEESRFHPEARFLAGSTTGKPPEAARVQKAVNG